MKVFVKSVVPFFGQNKYTNIRRFSTIFRHKTKIFSLQKVTSNIYILHAFSSSPKPPFFPNNIPISHTSQLTTHETYIFSIYGIRMLPQHSKPTRIHSNTISKFIPRTHEHLREILKDVFSYVFSRQYCI